ILATCTLTRVLLPKGGSGLDDPEARAPASPLTHPPAPITLTLAPLHTCATGRTVRPGPHLTRKWPSNGPQPRARAFPHITLRHASIRTPAPRNLTRNIRGHGVSPPATAPTAPTRQARAP